jgi:hypothetical protein
MSEQSERILTRIFFIDPLLGEKNKPKLGLGDALVGKMVPFVVSHHDVFYKQPTATLCIEYAREKIQLDGGIWVDSEHDGLTVFIPQSAILPIIAGPESMF